MRRALLFILAIAVLPAGLAVAQSTGLKVTGGGQVIAGGQTTGPGDTIAFNAQQIGDADTNGVAPANGQLQVIDRGNAEKFHGNVTCIREFSPSSGPNQGQRFVRFGGFQKLNGQQTATPFTVDVKDNGEGASGGNDMIFFRQRQSGDDPCDTSDQSTNLRSSTLARGNVQEH